MRLLSVALSLLLVCARLLDGEHVRCGVTVVLVGATGDLAKRYLWPALLHHVTNSVGCKVVVFGGTRKLVANDDHMWSLVSSNIHCQNKPASSHNTTCYDTLMYLRDSTHFVQLGGESDYKVLHTTIGGVYQDMSMVETGRVFYLSVPPSAYPAIVTSVGLHARPQNGAWLRVVLEKPFGEDLSSAKLLAGEVSLHLAEEEVYRVDHYLGKLGVQQIAPFRENNRERLSPLWNRDHIERIEVAVKERLDVKGRTSFYNKYGVIRDVLQNHLTEMLSLLTMDLPGGGIQGAKLDSLSHLFSPRLHHALLGQYTDYSIHLLEEGTISSSLNVSLTPTFAAVALFSKDPAWAGVPFILVSGKNLGKRTSYAKVVFKESVFGDREGRGCQPHVTFLVQDEDYSKPGILVSEHFSSIGMELESPTGWNEDQFAFTSVSTTWKDCGVVYHSPELNVETNAYVSLMGAVLDGRKEYFVDTATLLESWRVWTPLLRDIDSGSLIPYSPDDLRGLEFHLKGTSIVPTHKHSTIVDSPLALVSERFELLSNHVSTQWTELFGQESIVASQYSVVSSIASELYRAAVELVSHKGAFHLALPGGKSPIPLFEILALDYHLQFPWQHTHIWQTDERCVDRWSEDSNLRMLSNQLISHVPVPFHHTHPLPVDLQNGLCQEQDGGWVLYEKEITECAGRLDYVILGVGSDGHVASLFPGKAVMDVTGGIVTLKPSHPLSAVRRMSLSYEAITAAERITVLFSGAGKGGLMKKIAGCVQDYDCDMPVVKLMRMARKGQVAVYIDSDIV